MKEIKYNAKVIENFNDKKNLDNKGNPTLMEVGEIMKNLDRARFEELKAKGFVVEDKSVKDDEWE